MGNNCKYQEFEPVAFSNGIKSVMKIIPELMSERILTERTIHVISSPCRVCFTRALQKFAVNMYYEPYVLGKYKQKNVLMFKIHDFGI